MHRLTRGMRGEHGILFTFVRAPRDPHALTGTQPEQPPPQVRGAGRIGGRLVFQISRDDDPLGGGG